MPKPQVSNIACNSVANTSRFTNRHGHHIISHVLIQQPLPMGTNQLCCSPRFNAMSLFMWQTESRSILVPHGNRRSDMQLSGRYLQTGVA